MIDWTASMQHTFEYYTVDPNTWKDVKLVDNVKSSTINRDSEADTLGSATIDITESLGESYIRIYLIAIQNGVKYKFPLGTFLIQTPSSSFDGKIRSVSVDAYTPLLELKENPPPLGYSIMEEDETGNRANIMEYAYMLIRENARAPVVKTESDITLENDFVANSEDTWLTFLIDLIANAKYTFDLDELGRIMFAPKQDTASLQPVWDYTDDNSSILYSDITVNHDLYDIPNVVEVVYTNGGYYHYAVATNDDVNSPVSTVNRGRVIKRRITNPDLGAVPKGSAGTTQVQQYAEQALRDLSTVEYTASYRHGYCPVRVGDCVRLNYTRAGLTDIKAKVISQSIKCEPGCPVDEKAVFTMKLWR